MDRHQRRRPLPDGGRPLHALHAPDGLPSDLVFSLALRPARARLWVGTNGGGLARYADGRFRVYGAARRAGRRHHLVAPARTRTAASGSGTYGAGLFRREGDRFRGLTDRAPASAATSCGRSAQDHEGSLWIGTNTGGLARLRDGKFTTYTTREGLPHDVAKTVLAAPRRRALDRHLGRRAWRASRTASSRPGRAARGCPTTSCRRCSSTGRAASGSAPTAAASRASRTGAFRDLHRAGRPRRRPRGRAGRGPGGRALDRHQRRRAVPLPGRRASRRTPARDGLGANLVMATLVDRHGALWVGTDGGGLTRIADGKARTFTVARRPGRRQRPVPLRGRRRARCGSAPPAAGSRSSKAAASRRSRPGTACTTTSCSRSWRTRRAGLWLSGQPGPLARRQARPARPAGAQAAGAAGLRDRGRDEEQRVFGGVAAGGDPPARRAPGLPDHPRHRRGRPRAPAPQRDPAAGAGGGAAGWRGHATWASAGSCRRAPATGRSASPPSASWPRSGSASATGWSASTTIGSTAGSRRSAFYTQVPPGEYTFEVLASNNDGVWSAGPARMQVVAAAALPPDPRVLRPRGRVRGAPGGLRLRDARARPHRPAPRAGAAGRGAHPGPRGAAAARRRGPRRGGAAARDRPGRDVRQDRDAPDRRPRPEEPPRSWCWATRRWRSCTSSEGKPVGEFVGHIHLRRGPHARRSSPACSTRPPWTRASSRCGSDRLDLGGVARQVVEASRAAAARKGQQLDLVIEAELPVTGDAERLVEVVENLVGNAIKYSPFSAKIVVAAAAGGRARPGRGEGPRPGPDRRGQAAHVRPLPAALRHARPAASPPPASASRSPSSSPSSWAARLYAESAGRGRGACFTLSMPLTPAS